MVQLLNTTIMTNFINKFFTRNQSSVAPLAVSPVITAETAPHKIAAGDFVNSNPELNQSETVERVVLSEHGFNLAARSGGDESLLKSSLNRIYHGHLVDVNQNEHDQVAYRNQREKELSELEKQRIDMEAEKSDIEKNHLPFKSAELNKQKDKIHELKINKAEQELLSEYKPFWFYTYAVLVAVMALFLVFFYANVIFNAFYRNIIQEVVGSNTNNVGMLLNALFTDKLFEQKPIVLIQVFLTAFLFFGFGLLPHKILQNNKLNKTGKYVFFTLALLGALVIEALLAHKVHTNIEAVQMLILSDDQFVQTHWYFSPMFYTIVILGFGVYMVWAYFLELAMEMHGKRDNGKVVKLHINRIEDAIDNINKEISLLKTRLSEIDAQIKKNVVAGVQLKQAMHARVFDKALLKRNIEQFYGGWLKHLSSAEHLRPKIDTCEAVYSQFLKGIDGSEQQPTAGNLLMSWMVFFLLGFATVWCSNVYAVKIDKPLNVVMVLDLSDRLLNNRQFEADSAVLMTAFDNFYRHVQFNNLFIKSNDCFKVVVAPQNGTNHAVNEILQQMHIDMAAIDMAKRKQRINAFKHKLPDLIKQLYKAAYKGSLAKNYAGSDIWQYANEQLNTDVLVGYHNMVVFVTDGYMDFENANHAIQNNNKFTHTHFIKKLAGNNWQQMAIKQQYGIIPVRHNWHGAKVLVVGFNSKQKNSLTELDKLHFFWKQWLQESGIRQAAFVNLTLLPKMVVLVNDFFKL